MMNGKFKILLSAVLPILLIIGLAYFFLSYGPAGVFKAAFPTVENVFIQRIILEPEKIIVKVINDGPEPVTVSQVLVNDVYWQFSMHPGFTLEPLEKGTIYLNYPWLQGDPEHITILTKNGLTFEGSIEVATETPKFNSRFVKTFFLLGLYAGVIPVLLGLLWFPFLKKLSENWYGFLISLTVGLLLFLGFDALEEAFELVEKVPSAYNGIGLIVIGVSLSILALSAVSYKLEHHRQQKGEHFQALIWAYLIALGIGLHNMGEGLAIGSAYAIGEIALGSLLVIGFMIHNLTEGIAIIAPLTKPTQVINRFSMHLILMGLLAGVPTIIGALIGGFSYSAAFGILFLAIGAGAIFDVSFDILHYMAKGRWLSLFSVPNVLGFLSGLLIMYMTGFLVVG